VLAGGSRRGGCWGQFHGGQRASAKAGPPGQPGAHGDADRQEPEGKPDREQFGEHATQDGAYRLAGYHAQVNGVPDPEKLAVASSRRARTLLASLAKRARLARTFKVRGSSGPRTRSKDVGGGLLQCQRQPVQLPGQRGGGLAIGVTGLLHEEHRRDLDVEHWDLDRLT
jgi:hypothetical protein